MVAEGTAGGDKASSPEGGASDRNEGAFPQLSSQEQQEFRAWQAAQRQAAEVPDVAESATDSHPSSGTGGSTPGPRLPTRLWVPGVVALAGIVAVSLLVYLRFSSTLPDFSSVASDCENGLTLLQSSQMTGADQFFEGDASDEASALLDSAVEYIEVADDGSALTIDSRNFPYLDPEIAYDIDSQPDRDAALAKIESWNLIRDINSLTVVACVNEQLNLPDALQDRMNSTRALDGTQAAEYGDIVVSWKFHPDDGLSVVYERR